MSTSLISPPYEELQSLSQPLTNGELKFLDWLKNNLTSDWEIYVQPYMNGLRPDFVLLSPKKGIAVYEVKDWDLSAVQYSYEGQPPKLIGIADGRRFHLGAAQDPVRKVQLYRSEILALYCPRLDTKRGFGSVVAGIVFPFSCTQEVYELLRPALYHSKMLEYPRHNVIAGCDLLISDGSKHSIRKILPTIYSINKEMSEIAADDLRHWLVEPEAPKDQRHNAFEDLDAKQRELVTTRTNTGGRRIQGPAGSGKTLVLCGRTARLIGERKRVLLITFNITLLNYLRDTISRFFAGSATSRRQVSKQYEILNFHYFCKRLAYGTGNEEAYKKIWSGAYQNGGLHDDKLTQEQLEEVLIKRLPKQAEKWAETLPENLKYDAILVDEAQDLRPEWWEVLIRCRKKDGEAMLAADRTQNVYSVDQTWSRVAKGFRGPWSDLAVSYRLPPEVTIEACRFIDTFLPKGSNLKPEIPNSENGLFKNKELSKLACLRWINSGPHVDHKVNSCLEAMKLMLQDSELSSLPLNYADLTFLVESEELGLALKTAIFALGIHFIDTFDKDARVARRKKMTFRLGDGRLKITTVFSFKGWETRALIVQVGKASGDRDHALFYTAITRLKISRPRSYLTVVSSAPEYQAFGKSWT